MSHEIIITNDDVVQSPGIGIWKEDPDAIRAAHLPYETRRVTLTLPLLHLEMIEAAAESVGVSRSEAVRAMIRQAVSDGTIVGPFGRAVVQEFVP